MIIHSATVDIYRKKCKGTSLYILQNQELRRENIIQVNAQLRSKYQGAEDDERMKRLKTF